MFNSIPFSESDLFHGEKIFILPLRNKNAFLSINTTYDFHLLSETDDSLEDCNFQLFVW